MYDSLQMKDKRGIFPEIDKRMGLKSGTACKYYQHVCQKARYPGIFTDSAKKQITNEIHQAFENCQKITAGQRQKFIQRTIVQYGKDSKGLLIFPDVIKSYVYQTFQRLNISVIDNSKKVKKTPEKRPISVDS